MGTSYVVEERLDRALVTQEWMSMFPYCILHNLISRASDHLLAAPFSKAYNHGRLELSL